MGLLVLVTGCATEPEALLHDTVINTGGNGTLKQAEAVFRKAEAKHAMKIAPKSYQKAKQALDEVKATMERKPDNKQAIQSAVDQFAFEADHLLHITKEVQQLRALNSYAMENVVLSAEYRLLAISDALKQPDPRRQTLYDQTVALSNAAKRIVATDPDTKNAAVVIPRHVNKSELDDAHTRIEQLQLQLQDSQDNNKQAKREQKTLNARIDSLERVVVELNNDKSELQQKIKDLKAQLNKPNPK
jgi:chromosome segregation ATPase